ncbi:protein, SNF2 family [Trichuris suis]|nr:protein, SNF2 family [Trichuris suis]
MPEEFANLLIGKMPKKRRPELRAVTFETVANIHRAMQSCPSEDEETAPPSGLTSSLMLHQRQALTWLLWREEQIPSGAILADDMGLGKTLSMLSLIVASNGLPQEKLQTRRNNLECMARRDGLAPSKGTLIICPTSILHQWELEIKQRVSPGLLRVCVHHGQKRKSDAWRLATYDVVITTYRILSSGLSKGKKEPKECDFEGPLFSILRNRIILDEAHTIKSPSTGSAQACYRLEALSRWALTGTPIHNNVKDLYSLLKFLRFRPFDDYQVWKTWMEVETDTGLNRTLSVVNSILLRRTKDQQTACGRPLISLPPKQVVVRKLALTTVEKDVYARMFVASRLYVEKFLANGVDVEAERHLGRLPQASHPRNVRGRFIKEELLQADFVFSFSGNTRAPTSKGSGKMQIIVTLLRLRQACCHMALVKQAVDLDALKGDSIEMDFERQFKELSFVEDYEDVGSHAVDQLLDESFESCKVKALIDTIIDVQKSAKEEHPKFVVVSEWVGLLDVISHHLRNNEITFTSITGPVPPEERTKRVERFNNLSSDPQVMLLSLTAGGVGLNLVGGNHLFILDLHWNPALELQAADRVHRLGQTRPVFIHNGNGRFCKFVCVDTIEERVLALQEKKLQLAHSVLTGVASNSMKALSLNDLRFLFDLDISPSTPTEHQVRRCIFF